MSKLKRILSKTDLKKRAICKKKGHKLHIIREDDGEVGAICSDYCKRCGHEFTKREAESLNLAGVHTERMYDAMTAGD